MEDTRKTRPCESAEQRSYELPETEAPFTGSVPGPLNIYYGFKFSVCLFFIGLLKGKHVDLRFLCLLLSTRKKRRRRESRREKEMEEQEEEKEKMLVTVPIYLYVTNST